jgi:hypothetical protein
MRLEFIGFMFSGGTRVIGRLGMERIGLLTTAAVILTALSVLAFSPTNH